MAQEFSGGQIGNLGHGTDFESVALIARIASTVKDEQFRGTVLQGVNEFVAANPFSQEQFQAASTALEKLPTLPPDAKLRFPGAGPD